MRSKIWSNLLLATLCVILRSRVLIIDVGACHTRGVWSRRSCGYTLQIPVFFFFFFQNRQIYPLERIYSLHAQIAPPSPPPLPPLPFKPARFWSKPGPHVLQNSAPPLTGYSTYKIHLLDKRIHAPPQLSDFVALRNGFYSFRAQAD